MFIETKEAVMKQVVWTSEKGNVRVTYSNFWYKVQIRNTQWRDAGSFRNKETAISIAKSYN